VIHERYRPVKKMAARVIDGRVMMLTIADSRLHRLNATGTRVWQGIEAGKTVTEIIDTLCGEFAVDRERASADVTALLTELVARGIVAPATEESPEALA
jgi:hypothetical protein